MSAEPKLDGRRASDIDAELRRRALAVLTGNGRSPPLGTITEAILAVAARIEEEVTSRIDKAPAKQKDNFYNAAGIGRDPARPAKVPVAFVLAQGAKAVLSAPAQTQLMVDADGPVIFETETRIDLAPGTIAALRGLDAQADAIAIPSASVMAAVLPRAPATARRLRGGAAAGATKIQIDPVAGLEPGTLLQLGTGDAAREHMAVAVEGDLVTIEPALEAALAENTAAAEVTDFRPFAASTRNHQSHALYLGHAKLLDIPSAVTITVTGTALPAGAEWSWWGQLGDDDPPAWQPLAPKDGATLCFTKPAGKPLKTKIRDHESLWLRAKLPGRSAASTRARDVRIAIGGKICAADKQDICTRNLDELSVGFEAIANTTPVVTNSPFHPFGREPRLFDSFYIGSDEAFSKAGADVSLCFAFGGPDFGPLAQVGDATQIFALGGGNTLYRADFRADPPVLQPVPPPPALAGGATTGRSSLAAWGGGNAVWVAVGGQNSVRLATLTLDSKLDQPSVKWVQMALDAPHRNQEIGTVAFSGMPVPRLFAMVGPNLLRWDKLDGDTDPVPVGDALDDLLPIQGTPGALLAIGKAAPAGRALRVKLADAAEFADFAVATDLPRAPLTAWAADLGARLYIAGYDDQGITLARVDKDGGTGIFSPPPLPDAVRVPVTFEAAPWWKPDALPTLVVALSNPIRFVWTGEDSTAGDFREVPEELSIGASASRERAFVTGSGRTVVQRSDSGLLYRNEPAAGAGDKVYLVTETPLATPAAGLASPAWATLGGKPAQGGGFTLADENGGWRLLRALPSQPGAASGSTAIAYVAATPAKSGDITASKTVLRLYDGAAKVLVNPPADPPAEASGAGAAAGAGAGAATAVAAGNAGATDPKPPKAAPPKVKTRDGDPLDVSGDEVDILVSINGEASSIWHLTRSAKSDPNWVRPAGFPDPKPTQATPSPSLTYALLSNRGTIKLSEAVIAMVPTADQADFGRLRSSLDPTKAPTVVAFHEAFTTLLFPHDLILGDELLLSLPPEPWRILGPGASANPTLSWEYWNGESWWALGNRDLQDDTANFQKGGGIFFKAPADIRPTDVGGTTRYWIRARLVGGDYGEPKVTVTSGPGPNGTTEQVATRDVSTVRAPYITALKLGYCAMAPVRPEIVLAEDSLGAVDQTSANEAGLEFPVFTPVAELMNPVSAAEATARAASDAESCDDPCPAPAAGQASPCDAPGAYESCDSPCIAPPGYRPPAGQAAAGFVRGLMIGFSKPFAGETVSLYVDADPAGPPQELAADVLRGGRFTPVNVVEDSSYGLTEPGILTLALPGPPDLSDLFNASAHWLRLRPKGDPSLWSPRLRAIHLNGVMARSIETRAMERLGQSIGVADQLFTLAEAPVDPKSLELRVRELLSDEDRADPRLDIKTYAAGPSGDWVRWLETEDLVETATPGRVFVLDAESGGIRFGNGTNGRIPPLGADILAACYAHLTGRKANGVEPGKQLQLLSPLAGVERALALDNAAGGSDVEPLVSARRRAAAKVRHGGRILSRADLEDYALTLSPGIAQVRAERKGGGMRLIVAMAGAEARPSPAQLREFAAAIREVSGFGLARPGGLVAVGPRLLPLAVDLVLRPLTPDLFAEAAEQAKVALKALFDPATGNHDGKGWPLGRLPDAQDIAAALNAIEALAQPEKVTLERADKEIAAERALPASIPSDVLVRLDTGDIAFERAAEAAA